VQLSFPAILIPLRLTFGGVGPGALGAAIHIRSAGSLA